jgi:hypothetical protein
MKQYILIQTLKRKFSLSSFSPEMLKGTQAYSRLPFPQPFSGLQTHSHKSDRFFLRTPLNITHLFQFPVSITLSYRQQLRILFNIMELKSHRRIITQVHILSEIICRHINIFPKFYSNPTI